MAKRIIHICQNYNTSLYFKLFSEIQAITGINQVVFYPFIKTTTEVKSSKNVIVHSKKSVNHLLRHFFLIRALLNCKNLFTSMTIHPNDIIHCHTLFNDGIIGLIISLIHKNQLIISIRQTDVQIHRYKFWLRPYLFFLRSRNVKFIALSPSISKEFNFLRPKVIGNGVDSEFYSHRRPDRKKIIQGPFKAICIGRLTKEKNIDFLYAHRHLFNKLIIIGNNKPETNFSSNLKVQLKTASDIEYHESLDKNEIIKKLDESDVFILLAMKETFGIVYLEALSRGIPIINFKNSGVSGLFMKKCSYEIEKLTEKELSKALSDIRSNYNAYCSNALEESKKYSWRKISYQIISLYGIS